MPASRYLNGILTVLAVLLALSLWVHLAGGAPSLDAGSAAWAGPVQGAAAPAGLPDAGAQRKEQIELLRALVQKADELKELLKSGNVRVRMEAGGDRK